jgi:haloacid dehalogenase-like hydrolase
MRCVCLTCDYDGTIAHDGRVAPSTMEALKKVRASGRKLALAAGRLLDDLLQGTAGAFDASARRVVHQGRRDHCAGTGFEKSVAQRTTIGHADAHVFYQPRRPGTDRFAAS